MDGSRIAGYILQRQALSAEVCHVQLAKRIDCTVFSRDFFAGLERTELVELKRLLYCAAFVTGREGGGLQSGAVGFVLGLLLGDAVADEEVSLLGFGNSYRG